MCTLSWLRCLFLFISISKTFSLTNFICSIFLDNPQRKRESHDYSLFLSSPAEFDKAALNSDVLFLACMDLSAKHKCIGLCFVFRCHTVMMSKDGQVPDHHQDFQVSLHNMTYRRFKAKSVSILVSLFSFLESVLKMKTTKYNNNQRKPSFD